jgi:GDSL-like lipase/acylhydrolase family protein
MSGSASERRNHIALLGDSIFDNAAYTRGAPDVVTHLRRLLPNSWKATLCAVDGATTLGLAAQLSRVPRDASHLVIAIGGNDALQNSDLLSLPVSSSAQALAIFADRVAAFERTYRTAIVQAVRLERQTAICTVYNGALEAERATIARVGLTLFNDVILRTAIDLRLDALELRSICSEPADYANPIEPSDQGGLKIARAISLLVGAVHRADSHPARVWAEC